MSTRKKMRLAPPERLEDRLVPAGLLDATFSADGKAIFDPTGDDYGQAAAVDSQGRIVVACP